MSDWLTTGSTVLVWLELLLLHPAVLAIALLNLTILCSTRILHPNLRFILQVQSVAVIGFEFYRLATIVYAFMVDDVFSIGPVVLQRYGVFITFFRNSMGHVLLVERMLATFFYKKYEKSQNVFFSLCWITLLMLISLFNSLASNKSVDFTIGNVITTIFLVLLSFIEYLSIFVMGIYNRRKYSRFLPDNNYSLNQKFQLAENVRSSRQLCPVFFCHLVNSLELFVVGTLLYVGLIGTVGVGIGVTAQFSVILGSSMDLVMEATVITHHPLMKKKLRLLLRKIFFCESAGSVGDSQEGDQPQDQQDPRCHSPPKNLNGEQLIRRDHPDRHFGMLTNAWR